MGDHEDVMWWIPVTEGVPDNEEYVLCTTIRKDGGRQVVRGYWDKARHIWVCGMNSNVVAWMLLPKPWKGEDDG